MAKKKKKSKSKVGPIPFLTSPEVRPWPVTPPPPQEEVRKCTQSGKRRVRQMVRGQPEVRVRFRESGGIQGLKVLDIGLWRMGHKFASSCRRGGGRGDLHRTPRGGSDEEADPLREGGVHVGRQGNRGEMRSRLHCEMVNKHSSRSIETKEGQDFPELAACGCHRRGHLPGYMDNLGSGTGRSPGSTRNRLLLGGHPRIVGFLQGQGLQARSMGTRSLLPVHEPLCP